MDKEKDWLAELRQIYETDKAYKQAQKDSQPEAEAVVTAGEYLQRCSAHELMRQVQKTLLDGGGKLEFYENVGGYEQAVVLMWAGPISEAAKPATIEDVDASIIVGANAQGVFVNDERLANVSPDALRQRLLELAQGFVAGRERRDGDASV